MLGVVEFLHGVHRDWTERKCCLAVCGENPVTNFHFAYFCHYGLDLGSLTEQQHGDTLFKIVDFKLLAQVFLIFEQRLSAHMKVPSLTSLCIYNVWEHHGTILHKLNIPSTILKRIEDFDEAFDLADRSMAFTPGNTIFRPLVLPRFLLRHVHSGFNTEFW